MMNAYEILEFDRIKSSLVEFSKTERGKELLLSLEMSDDYDTIKRNIDELQEMIDFISRYSELTLSNSVHLVRLIELAKKTAILTPSDLNFISLDIETSEKLLSQFRDYEETFPLLKEYFSKFNDLSSLKKMIKKTISANLTVNDSASAKLKEIRAKIKSLESSLNARVLSISHTYSSYLSDGNVTLRDGHFVLPVKTGYKNKVLGIIYDVSDSGNTTFIEPLEIVQLNNDITSKKLEENEEVRKILKELTSLVLLQENEVIQNNEIIAKLDFIHSKALYALSNDYHLAELSAKEEIHLYSAYHPLLDKNSVVANEYHLDEENRIVVISGPNAGGKTVSLKTVGIITMMNQCGLPLPIKEGKLGIFKHIYLDIGDNQSLSDNLSTFSSHMKNIAEILKVSKGKDLVLLDELGTGTDPKEGEIIALTILKELEKRHSLALISSHYSKIKEYAFKSKNVKNSSMLFDEENLLPTYKYKYDIPGKSYGFEVAIRYGISKEAIEEVKNEYKKENENDFDTLISKLQKSIDENERFKKENEARQLELEKKEKSLLKEEQALLNRKEHLLEEVKKEKEAIIEEISEQADEMIKALSKSDIKLHEAIDVKKKIENLKDDVVVINYDEEIIEGDYVSIPSLNLEGKVERISGQKAHILSSDGLALDVKLSTLHKIEPPKVRQVINKNNNYEHKINVDVGLELNIIGLHKDEAKEALIKYLDACKIKNLKTVRIIHGFGSGVLRKMVHEYLASLKGVKYRLGDISEGGGGATVVTLHE